MSDPRDMRFEDAQEIVFERFTTAWGATTPIAYDNVPYVPVIGTPYVELSMREPTSRITAFGATRLFRRSALALTRVAVPMGAGPRLAAQYAEQVRDVWEATSFGPGIDVLDGVSLKHVPDGGASGWLQIVVTAPLTYYRKH